VTTICEHMLTYRGGKLLKTMGVFRESGKKTAQIELEEALERGDQLNLETQRHGSDPHVLAGVLKLWLRQLPQPVCTFELYTEFLNAVKKERADSVQPLRAVIKKLPVYNYALLEYMVGCSW
jgi:RhoGAP domain